MARTRIIIDTDPGQDDAVALLLALAERDALDVAAITTVAGNVPLALTTMNALRIVELARRDDVPVHPGASQPLLRELKTAEFICGADGLEGAGLPPPRSQAQSQHAVAYIIETLAAASHRSVTLCTLGPLTNVALAFGQEPTLATKIERIVLMGGARDLGNVTPAAEFNFHVDPHAAAMTLRLPVPVVMFGLHATHQAMGTPERIDRIAALGTPVAHAVHGMLKRPRPGGIDRFGVPGHPLHDPLVIAYVLWPDLFTGRDCHVEVETAGDTTLGRSTIDGWGSRRRVSNAPPNAHVIGHVDVNGFYERLTASLAKLS